MTVDWCRSQQLRAAEALQQPEPPDWARLALFDAFTEELLLEGAFERAGLREFCDDAEIHVSFGDSGKLTLFAEEVDHAR